MVAAYHLIWTVYGYWLPNDPRGSTSLQVHCAKIAELGSLHYGRKRIQPAGTVIREFYEAAAGVLKHKLLTFTPEDAQLIACGFADAIKQHNYTCYACAVMPDHAHLVLRKHRDQAEEMIANFQETTRTMVRENPRGQHGPEHPVWGGPGWKVFLNSQEDIRRTIDYVEQNPVKIGRPMQDWPFVKPYDGWLPGRGAAKPQASGGLRR